MTKTYNIIPIWSRNRNTAIEVQRTPKKVRFIQLCVDQPLRVSELGIAAFTEEWAIIPEYTEDRAVAHFKRVGGKYGALKEVRAILGIKDVEDTMPEQMEIREVPTAVKEPVVPGKGMVVDTVISKKPRAKRRIP